jgi:hypothetical protein
MVLDREDRFGTGGGLSSRMGDDVSQGKNEVDLRADGFLEPGFRVIRHHQDVAREADHRGL